MVNFDEEWLPQQSVVVTNLLKIWVKENFQEKHKKIVSIRKIMKT